jgi:hypothetical protein
MPANQRRVPVAVRRGTKRTRGIPQPQLRRIHQPTPTEPTRTPSRLESLPILGDVLDRPSDESYYANAG